MTEVRLGRGVNIDHTVYDRSGALTNAAVTIVVTKPDGTAWPAPNVTNPSTGRYQADTFVPDAAGLWTGQWLVTGAVTDVVDFSFDVVTPDEAVPLGGPYATLSQLKYQMGIKDSDTSKDADLTRRLSSAAVDINRWTHRQFGRAEVATPRYFYAGRSGIETHDFWTAEDLAITPYTGQTAGTPWDAATVILEPLNGIVDEVPGWPFRRIAHAWGDHPLTMAMLRFGGRVEVVARWGWESCPGNVTTANLMLAAADEKARDAPFGVAGFGDYAVRIRSNPMVVEKLAPYVIDPIKVAS